MVTHGALPSMGRIIGSFSCFAQYALRVLMVSFFYDVIMYAMIILMTYAL